jgi:hypothetical protein
MAAHVKAGVFSDAALTSMHATRAERSIADAIRLRSIKRNAHTD